MAKTHSTPDKITLERLRANPKNPRKIGEEKLAMLAEAMRTFGDLGGIILNRRTLQLVGGHQRTAVFRKFARENAVSIKIDKTYDAPTKQGTVLEGSIAFDGASYGYREVDWPEDVEQAANIAANRGAGEFDIPLLKESLNELDALNFDLNLTMFDAKELDDLFGGKEIEEVVPEEQAITEQFRILVNCRDEQQQAEVLEWLNDRHIDCKPMIA